MATVCILRETLICECTPLRNFLTNTTGSWFIKWKDKLINIIHNKHNNDVNECVVTDNKEAANNLFSSVLGWNKDCLDFANIFTQWHIKQKGLALNNLKTHMQSLTKYSTWLINYMYDDLIFFLRQNNRKQSAQTTQHKHSVLQQYFCVYQCM
jgi:hypothetical protein